MHVHGPRSAGAPAGSTIEPGATSAPPVTVATTPGARGDRYVQGTAPAPSVEPAALAAAWREHLLARVEDAQLAASVDALFAHHLARDFFGERVQGMRRAPLSTPGGPLDLQFTPNRAKVPVVELHHAGQAECALCRPPFVDERGLRWRDYVVWPNAFPYLPPDQQHVVITAARHVGQQFTPQILEDMIDYQRAAGQGAPVTLHYNGIAGNSQFHLHWQASRERLPLQRLLDAGALPLQPVHAGAGGRVESYEQGFYAGLLVSGDRAYVSRMASRIVGELDRDPTTRGAYNLLLLHPRRGEARLVVIPRRADCLKPELPSFGKVGLGAFSLGGTIVVPRDDVPPGFGDEVLAAARATLVPPSELPWLEALRAQLDNPLLALRTRGEASGAPR